MTQTALAKRVSELAAAAGMKPITQQGIAKIESGGSKHTSFLPFIAEVTGFRLEWLFYGTGAEQGAQEPIAQRDIPGHRIIDREAAEAARRIARLPAERRREVMAFLEAQESILRHRIQRGPKKGR